MATDLSPAPVKFGEPGDENFPASPDLSSNLKPRARAVKNPEQLAEVIKTLEYDNRERNQKNARIMSKYNAERPRSQAQLDAEGVGWKSNFASQPLATLIDRISPRLARTLDAARYLTNATFPTNTPGSAQKVEVFRTEFTSMVRNHPEWKDLIQAISQEDSLFGYTSASYTNEDDWFPKHFRQDEFFVPAATKQNSKHCPLYVAKETFLPHELFELIDDKDSAETAGWDIKNTAAAINDAMPEDVTRTFDNARLWEDLRRESNLCTSLAKGSKVIIAYHAFAVEVTGKVSHYIIDGRTWKELFVREDQFDSMDQVTTFFSFQQANGNLQGSKGVGRTVYTLAGIVDRSRNEVVDRLQLSGKLILQGEDAKIRQFKMSVVGSAIVISKNYTLSQHKIDSGVDAFLTLDNWVVRLMDEIAGNVSPGSAANQIQGERPTNGQINWLADLNNEVKDIKIERFLMQAAQMLWQMQKRAVKKGASDELAKNFRAKCLLIMSEEELEALAKHPAAGNVEDFTEQERQQEILVATEILNDPMVNRKEVLRRKISAAVSPDFADAVLLPDEDPTVLAEQTRLAEMENLLFEMGKGANLQPSPRDNHQIHLDILLGAAEALAPQAAENPQGVATVMKALAQHGLNHVQLGQSSGQLQNPQNYVDKLTMMQQGADQLLQQAEAAQAALPAEAAAPTV